MGGKKRIGIYVFYHQKGLVYSYVDVLLKHISVYLEHLIIVVNGTIDTAALDKLKGYTPFVITRENTGFDAGAYREVIENPGWWDMIGSHDELLLFNSSFFGPLFPLSDVFQSMEKENIDFWGITSHGALIYEGKKRGRHLQSYFLVINKKMYADERFRSFWAQFQEEMTYAEVVAKFEISFTEYFEKLGYRWASYTEAECVNWSAVNAINPYRYFNHTLLVNDRLPFIKIKSFVQPAYGFKNMNEDAARSLDFIQKRTSYDCQLIWEYLLHNFNMYDLYHRLHLKYVLPDSELCDSPVTDKALLILYGSEKEQQWFMKKTGDDIDVIFFTSEGSGEYYIVDDVRRSQLSDLFAEPLYNGNEEAVIRKLLLKSNELAEVYDYLGFYFMEKNEISNLGEAKKAALLWENLFYNKAYINNVIKCFQENPRLGVATFDSQKFLHEENFWKADFNDFYFLLQQSDIDVPMAINKPPISCSGIFWCRLGVFQEFNLTKASEITDRFNINERIWKYLPQYLAQCNGFYTAGIEMTAYAAMLIKESAEEFHHYRNEAAVTNLAEIIRYVSKPVYIYGSGAVGRRISRLLSDFEIKTAGFIVSDGQIIEAGQQDHIFHLSALEQRLEEAIVIIAINNIEEQERFKIKEHLLFLNCLMVLTAW